MSSPWEQKTFHKASRRGNSRAATGRGAGRACCGDSTSTGGVQDSTTTSSTRHVDRSINSSMSASRSARWPRGTQLTAAATAAKSRNDWASAGVDPGGRGGESQTTSGTRPGGEERTTVNDRGKPSRARPDERCSSPVAIQTFEAQALATRCSRRRVKVATNTAWRSSRPAWRQRPLHAQRAEGRGASGVGYNQTTRCGKRTRGSARGRANCSSESDAGEPWSAMVSGSWSAMTTAREKQRKPLTNQGTTLQKTVCVRRSRGETDALAKQRRRGASTAQGEVRNLNRWMILMKRS